MQLVYESKLYPSKKQEETLLRLLEDARNLYNSLLERKIEFYRESGKNISRFELQKELKGKYLEIPGSLKQMVVYRVNIAFQRFFQKISHFPRFKGEGRYRTLELRQYEADYRFKDGKLSTWKIIGDIRMRGFREAQSSSRK